MGKGQEYMLSPEPTGGRRHHWKGSEERREMLNLWLRWQLLREQKGQGLVEYALIIVLVAIAVVVAITALGTQIASVFNSITTKLSNTG
jgi:pilus assembly protein Flp/PilA